MSELQKELSRIQKELHAPKNQVNSFAKYRYRSCEDILTGLKKVIGVCSITLSDSIKLVGDRIYVEATATLSLGEERLSVNGFAREPLTKKGSDESQITGATSSYARKYALNGLFAIDDTKDSDSMDNSQQPVEPQRQTPQQNQDNSTLGKIKAACGIVGSAAKQICEASLTKNGVNTIGDLLEQEKLLLLGQLNAEADK